MLQIANNHATEITKAVQPVIRLHRSLHIDYLFIEFFCCDRLACMLCIWFLLFAEDYIYILQGQFILDGFALLLGIIDCNIVSASPNL